MEKIITGSRAFFDGMEGFTPHDTDAIKIVDEKDVNFLFRRRLYDREDGCDTFYVVRQPKQQYLRWAAKFASGATLGQFLTPEFCREFGITVSDLEHLRPMTERIDKRHKYLTIIYDAYIANKNMSLTDEQRQAAYEEYQKERRQ
jgi:hypothetical protein